MISRVKDQEAGHRNDTIAKPVAGNEAAKWEKDNHQSSSKLARSDSDGSKAGKVRIWSSGVIRLSEVIKYRVRVNRLHSMQHWLSFNANQVV